MKTTDDQILKGFNQLDQDNDGRLNKSDFIRYLKESLHVKPSVANIDLLFKQLDSNEDGYINYDEFREFLLLVPRLQGSRIKTAFTFLFEEYDINSDGDVTLINQFWMDSNFSWPEDWLVWYRELVRHLLIESKCF